MARTQPNRDSTDRKSSLQGLWIHRVLFSVGVLILAWGGTTQVALGQNPPQKEDPSSVAGIPMAVVTRPIPLRSDLTRIRHPVSSSDEEARRFHEQGLTYLHLYGYLEAARSFHQALRADPELGQARVGLALAYRALGDPEMALQAVEGLEVSRDAEPNPEDAWARIRLSLLQERSGREDSSHGDSAEAELERAVERHPEAVELRYLQATLARGDDRVAGLQEVLRLAPDHVGAHHLLIHVFENREGELDRAVAHGAVLASLAPGVAHARHMFGHNLRRVGRVQEAIREFEAAQTIERTLEEEENIPTRYDWHHGHNLALLGMSYHHQGRMEEAEAILTELAELPAQSDRRWLGQNMNRVELQLSLGRWDAARESAERLLSRTDSLTRGVGHLYAGLADLGMGDPESAEQSLEQGSHHLPDGHPFNTHQEALRALLSSEAGGSDSTESVGGEEDELLPLLSELGSRRGPDAWAEAHIRKEVLARLAASQDNWARVQKVARSLREHDPTYAGGYAWEAVVEDRVGAAPAAGEWATRALERWPLADEDLPGLQEMKKLAGRAR